MPEEEKLFYSIGEVAQIAAVKPYVLRYWESEFRKLNPQKSPSGQRAYRQRDLRVALTIKRLLYEEQFTIAGAIKKLEELDENQGLDPLTNLTLNNLNSAESLKIPPEVVLSGEINQSLNEEIQKPQQAPSPSSDKVTELKNLISETYSILKKHNLA